MPFQRGADPRLIGLGPAILALAAGNDDLVELIVARRRLEQRARQLPSEISSSRAITSPLGPATEHSRSPAAAGIGGLKPPVEPGEDLGSLR